MNKTTYYLIGGAALVGLIIYARAKANSDASKAFVDYVQYGTPIPENKIDIIVPKTPVVKTATPAITPTSTQPILTPTPTRTTPAIEPVKIATSLKSDLLYKSLRISIE